MIKYFAVYAFIVYIDMSPLQDYVFEVRQFFTIF